MMERANACAPPPASRNAPSKAPSPTMMAIKPRTPPIPFWIEPMTASGDRPAARPVKSADKSKAGNAGILRCRIKNNSAATPAIVAQRARVSGASSNNDCTVPPPFGALQLPAQFVSRVYSNFAVNLFLTEVDVNLTQTCLHQTVTSPQSQ